MLLDALAGATIEFVHEHALHDRIECLPALAPTLIYILLAFIGAKEAAEVASQPSVG